MSDLNQIHTALERQQGQSTTHNIIYFDITIEVQPWKLALDYVIIDLGGGKRISATKYFTLSEVR